jgi:hypothetical protein
MYKYFFRKVFFNALSSSNIRFFIFFYLPIWFLSGSQFFPREKGRVEAGGGGQVVSFADVGRREGGEERV